jgi:hypothetical protein
MDDDQSEKGPELRLTRGSYKGKTAWVDPYKKPTKEYIYVIILEDDLVTEFTTRVKRTSVGKPLSPPESYEEAALQQHPKILNKMDDLAKELAMCSIQAGNHNIHNIFEAMIVAHVKKQDDDNENAKYKKVIFKKKEDDKKTS